tara:strand:+ start:1079 stop:1510 length:432 start_codon:yes stop_codon:yes gene_type:complete
MVYTCIDCTFSAPTRSRYERHLGTKKHIRNTEFCETVQEYLVSNEENIQNDDIEELLEHDIDTILDSYEINSLNNEYLEPIIPFPMDMESIIFMQSLYNTLSNNKYLIYTIGFCVTLYSAVQDFINPQFDDSIEYIDCSIDGT